MRSVRDQLFVTFPRVTTVAELKQARALLEGVFRQLAGAKLSDARINTGRHNGGDARGGWL